MEQTKKTNSFIYLLIATVLLLLGYLVYDSIANDGLSQEEIVAEMNDLRNEYDNIQLELNKNNNKVKNKSIEILKIQKELKTIFDKKNITEEELIKTKKLIKDLSKIANQNLKKEIVVLETENNILIVKNENLEIKTAEQEKSITELKTKLTKELTVSKSKDKLLDYASNLMASNFILKSFKVRDNGKEIPTEKGSRVDRIKVFFDIPANKIAKSGKTTLYVKIILPDGKLAIVEGKNDLKFKSEENLMVDCTEVIEINYIQGKEETVSFNWDNKDGFESGDYMFEVYQNGRLIGKASKFLR